MLSFFMKLSKKKNLTYSLLSSLALLPVIIIISFMFSLSLEDLIIKYLFWTFVYSILNLIFGKNMICKLLEKKVKVQKVYSQSDESKVNDKVNDNVEFYEEYYEEYKDLTNELIAQLWFKPISSCNIFDHILSKYGKKKKIPLRLLDEIFKIACKHMKLNYDILAISYSKDNMYSTNSPGEFCPNGKIGGEINISLNEKYSLYNYISVICHECCHYFMYVNDIDDYYNNLEEEYTTDILAVYFGFEKYMKQGYSFVDINGKYIFSTKKLVMGYIPFNHIDMISNIINESKDDIKSNNI